MQQVHESWLLERVLLLLLLVVLPVPTHLGRHLRDLRDLRDRSLLRLELLLRGELLVLLVLRRRRHWRRVVVALVSVHLLLRRLLLHLGRHRRRGWELRNCAKVIGSYRRLWRAERWLGSGWWGHPRQLVVVHSLLLLLGMEGWWLGRRLGMERRWKGSLRSRWQPVRRDRVHPGSSI